MLGYGDNSKSLFVASNMLTEEHTNETRESFKAFENSILKSVNFMKDSEAFLKCLKDSSTSLRDYSKILNATIGKDTVNQQQFLQYGRNNNYIDKSTDDLINVTRQNVQTPLCRLTRLNATLVLTNVYSNECAREVENDYEKLKKAEVNDSYAAKRQNLVQSQKNYSDFLNLAKAGEGLLPSGIERAMDICANSCLIATAQYCSVLRDTNQIQADCMKALYSDPPDDPYELADNLWHKIDSLTLFNSKR
ncbi:hypothetical protein Ciccas_001648 [Cichlidogyrus casuarinus]|uniref:Uncharacterized protein n=1 Tax=Cichlidogyrus casuarinus TaxID=1844966 RepID=A0ABD2QJF8_9PLAT